MVELEDECTIKISEIFVCNKNQQMAKFTLMIIVSLLSFFSYSQRPCSDTVNRQFDFWLGEWEVFAKNGNKAGDSKVSIILDSCVLLEEWTSAAVNRGVRYAGKSFNTWNAQTRQWQQVWVDNAGGTTEYLEGRLEGNKMMFKTGEFRFNADTMATRRLTFYHLGKNQVRQHGEISKDNMRTWLTEYDLEYRRKL